MRAQGHTLRSGAAVGSPGGAFSDFGYKSLSNNSLHGIQGWRRGAPPRSAAEAATQGGARSTSRWDFSFGSGYLMKTAPGSSGAVEAGTGLFPIVRAFRPGGSALSRAVLPRRIGHAFGRDRLRQRFLNGIIPRDVELQAVGCGACTFAHCYYISPLCPERWPTLLVVGQLLDTCVHGWIDCRSWIDSHRQ